MGVATMTPEQRQWVLGLRAMNRADGNDYAIANYKLGEMMADNALALLRTGIAPYLDDARVVVRRATATAALAAAGIRIAAIAATVTPLGATTATRVPHASCHAPALRVRAQREERARP